MIRVETVLDTWKTIRADTAQAVEDSPPEELDWRPAPDMMTFRETARHILGAGHGMTGLLLAGMDNLQVPNLHELMLQHVPPPANTAAELASALRSSVEQRCAELVAQPPEFFSGFITRFDGVRVTRLEMIQFVKEHELTHRSQLFMCLRLKGIVPATTRRRQRAKA